MEATPSGGDRLFAGVPGREPGSNSPGQELKESQAMRARALLSSPGTSPQSAEKFRSDGLRAKPAIWYLIVSAALTASAGVAGEPLFFVEDFCSCSGGGSTIQCGVPFYTVYGSSVQATPEGLELENSSDWVAAFFVGPSVSGAPIYSEFSVRARVRRQRLVGSIGIATRHTSDSSSYNAELGTNNEYYPGGGVFLYRGGGGIYIIERLTRIDFNPFDEDVILQVDVHQASQTSQNLKVWAWSASAERQQDPCCDGNGDTDVLPGRIAFFSTKDQNEPGSDPTIWRYVMVFPLGEEPFLRGDANGDGAVDISDAVRILGYLFTGDAEPACLDAADANDSAAVDISDPIYLLGHLFLGGPAPDDPFDPEGTCGVDPTPLDGLSCLSYEPCESYERQCDE
jgi:hypothetical protein